MEKMGKTVLLLWIVCLPGLLSATCSSNDSTASSTADPTLSSKFRSSNCVNGYCGEDGTCSCNPCWGGSTCQEYIDRFAPRFLADEPFFMVTPAMAERRDEEGREVPLFRLESADDDLGLTCQLGQVGPAATCPCATPRYKVIGPSQAVFRADQETGDVFIKPGFSLQPGKHYLITLQVSALEVNASGYHPWKEHVTSTLYIKRKEELQSEHFFYFPLSPTSSSKDEDDEQDGDDDDGDDEDDGEQEGSRADPIMEAVDLAAHKSRRNTVSTTITPRPSSRTTPTLSAYTVSPLTQLRSFWMPFGEQQELLTTGELNKFKSRSKRYVKYRGRKAD